MKHPSRVQSKVALGAVGALLAAAVSVLAIRDPGYPAKAVDLSQPVVWVTNNSQLLVGRINKQVGELDSAVKVNAPFDVFQDGETVVVLDGSKHELRPLDVVSVTLGGKIRVPQQAVVALGGGILAVADEKTGAVWAGTPQDLSSLDPTTTAPNLKAGPDVAVAVSQSGRVFAADPGSDSLLTFGAGLSGAAASAAAVASSGAASTDAGSAEPAKQEQVTLPGGPLSVRASGQPSPISITAVGNVPVVLDRAAGVLRLSNRPVPIPGAASAVLQQPGPAADSVLVATSAALLRVPLQAGGPETVIGGRSGAPAAPVLLDGCAHAAWSSSPATYGLVCGTSAPAIRDVPGHTGSAAMVFRVNRQVIVLNDVGTGNAWTVDANLKLINNWDEVQPLSDTPDDTQGSTGTEGDSTEVTSSRTKCAGVVDPPAPTDDRYGVRAGRSTVLPVLDNDASSNCSMVVITGVDGWSDPDQAAVAVVDDGQALQVSIPAGVSGALPAIAYHVSDGQGHSAKASVSVTVVSQQPCAPPRKLHDSAVVVESLATVSYDVLPNYISPCGDDLFLAAASIDNGDEVTFQPNGTITFADKGVGGAVKKSVNFVVSDGSTQVAGTLTVDVRADGTAEPVPSPVYAVGMLGRPVTVNVLNSVGQPSLDPTRLAAVTPIGKVPVTVGGVNQAAGTVTLTGAKAGTYYFNYQVAAGSKSAQGLLRLDVTDGSTIPEPPVTMLDVVYLPTGSVTTVDPTANDTDPMGTGLAVIQVQPDPRLTVTTEGMQLVTISALAALPPGGVSVSYTVSNGVGTAQGLIRVVPVPAQDPVPPIAHDISATVRAGDAVTIPIAGHAVDPNGDVLTLSSLTGTLPAGSGVLFHTDSAIRYLAPRSGLAKPVQFGYTVTNSVGAAATGSVTISVDGAPRSVNHPPATPQPVLGRVFTGGTVTIPLPLDGIDPDGDWVTLQGITGPSTAPLGQATPSGLSSITYTAADRPGLDSFTYTAADPYGASTTGRVSVLVVAPPTTLQPPVAPNLDVTVRPGRVVGIDVLGPASAANGSVNLGFADPAFAAPDGWTVRVDPGTEQLVVDTPAKPTVASIKYSVADGAGLTGSGVLTVTVSATAALKPPTARDVIVGADSITKGQKTVDVPIPDANLSDPSGTTGDLVLSLDPLGAGAATVTGPRTVRVPLTDARQVLAYVVTNPDKATATAFIVVPPAVPETPPPSVKPTTPVAPTTAPSAPLTVSATGPALSVKAGQSLVIDVTRQVRAADGAALSVPNGTLPTVTGGGQIGRVDSTHISYTAPKDGNGTVYVGFLVTDGKRAPVGMSLPVTVIPVVIPAPVVQGVSLTVQAGQSVQQDVSRLVTAGNAEQQAKLSYRISGGGAGFSASLTGSTLTVKAELGAKGRTANFTLTATDGQAKSGTGTVTVAATGSTAPHLKVGNITIDDGRPGKASTANLLAAVTFNPFPTAPTVVSATVQSGKGTVGPPGPTVAITPAEVGTVVVAFTVRDATGDADRDVSATVTVTVKDKPSQPGTPTVVSMASKTVQLKWTAPKDNGSPITGYTVAAAGFTQPCPASPCTLTGLTNGSSYSFTVTATNAIGTSDPSVASASVTPDTAPNTPAAPILTWTAKAASLQVNWTDPGSDGTPVSSYDLQITPADTTGQTQVTVSSGTGYNWANLQYGTAYTFSVRAHNASPTPSGWSPASAPETPSTTAGPPQNAQAVFGLDQYNNGHVIAVSWGPPADDGGNAVQSYQISYSSSAGGSTITVPATATSSTIQGVQDGVTYTVTVAAVNRSGTGGPSNSSSATPFSPPGPVAGLKAQATGVSKAVVLTWNPAEARGRPITGYKVAWGGGQFATTAGLTYNPPGLANGTTYTFTVAACYTDPGICGDPSAPAQAIPYGPIVLAGGGASFSGGPNDFTPTFTWSAPAENGFSPSKGPYTYQVSGAFNGTTPSTSVQGGSLHCGGAASSITVVAVDSKGHESSPVTWGSGATPACPPTSWTATTGSDKSCPQPDFNWTRFHKGPPATCDITWIPANYSVTVKCYVTKTNWGYTIWYRISGGSFDGQYVAGGTTDLGDNVPAYMPGC